MLGVKAKYILRSPGAIPIEMWSEGGGGGGGGGGGEEQLKCFKFSLYFRNTLLLVYFKGTASKALTKLYDFNGFLLDDLTFMKLICWNNFQKQAINVI